MVATTATDELADGEVPDHRYLARVSRRRAVGLVVAVVVLAVMCVLSLAVGTQTVGLGTVWGALTDFTDTGDQWIVHDLRVPRTVLGVVVGVALGLCGALIQGVTRNPLADTQILGINSGASLCVVAAIAFGGFTSVVSYIWFAFLGALVAMMFVFLVGMTGRTEATPVRVVLAGVAIGAVMDGIGYTIRLRNPRAFDTLRFWDAGAFDARPLSVVWTILPFVVVGVLLAVYVGRSLNAVALGDDLATAMGGNVTRTRVLGLVAVTLLAGAATAAAGPIGFVGLMVPHVVRWFTGPDWRWICVYCVVAAPSMMLAADIVGRVVIPPGELPVGIVTAFIGAPVLVWLIRRSDASGL
ncbi:iron chelate uptake ABC transporter family permease subunit [Williamsia sterculiae]|uniref:Iron complex transport system permease protein n=1 Tax=Williamsia sterculiae TaxID=1344003 RepID=A0A1N7CEU3_9NOCA|nr:iron chelate uptake ABC transporter family permease subunit [Williamsia sterculiae]SIR62100.1 iron complex transport system permease protein [Williamsia sterculiae]